MSVSVKLVWESQLHFIVAHVPVARIESEEPSSPAASAVVRENHQVAHSLPARDGVRQP